MWSGLNDLLIHNPTKNQIRMSRDNPVVFLPLPTQFEDTLGDVSRRRPDRDEDKYR